MTFFDGKKAKKRFFSFFLQKKLFFHLQFDLSVLFLVQRS